MKLFIAYYRVSTQKQGQSGLGLEAQLAAVTAYSEQNDCRILASYTEVESGKITDRPELAKALAHARRAKATLVVAKLNRLARNVAFLSALMDTTVPFVAVDNAHTNRLTLHILAAVAEAEAKTISDRTKAALAAYKARGGELGASRPECRNLTAEGAGRGRENSAKVRSELAKKARDEIAHLVFPLRKDGLTLDKIAVHLNEEGWTTRQGRAWTPSSVYQVLKKASSDE